MSNKEVEFKLTGGKALIGAVLIMLFGIWKYQAANQALQSQGVEEIKQWLISEYSTYHMATLSDFSLPGEERTALLDAIQNISFRSVSARGPRDGMIVKVEIQPSIAVPPGSALTRYYEVSYSALTNRITYERDASALSYHLVLF
jgi:hypothetical protein